MKKFAEIISGKRLNFFIGAGTSSNVIPTLYILGGKINYIDLLNSDLIDELNKNKLIVYYYYHWVKSGGLNSLNNHSEYRDNLEIYKSFLTSILHFLSTEPRTKPCRVNIFTTNFDPMFELAFDDILREKDIDCFFCDGGRGFVNRHFSIKNFYLNVSLSGYFDNFKREIPTINLMKLHGSLTWKDSKEMIELNPTSSDHIINEIEKATENIGEDCLNSIGKVLTSDTDSGVESNHLISEINDNLTSIEIDSVTLESCLVTLKGIPIINPMDWKFSQTVFEQNYYQIIRALSYELENPDSVLISIGSSFSDTHINEIIQRSITNPKLLPIFICYNVATLEKLKNLFPSKQCHFFPSSVDFDTDPMKDNQIEKLKGDLSYLTNMIQSGDFDE